MPVMSQQKQNLSRCFVRTCVQLLTSCPLCLQLRLMSQCSGSIENIKRVSLILDDEEQPEELGLTGLNASDKQSGEKPSWLYVHGDGMYELQFEDEINVQIIIWSEEQHPVNVWRGCFIFFFFFFTNDAM